MLFVTNMPTLNKAYCIVLYCIVVKVAHIWVGD